jgi:hypothetical protein
MTVPPPYGQRPPVRAPGRGTVLAGAVIQLVQAGLLVLAGLAVLLIADLLDRAGDDFDREVGGIAGTLARWVAGAGLLLLAAAVGLAVLAGLALRGRRWAAVTSVALQAVAIAATVAGLVRSDSSPGGPLVFLLASAAVVVLFLHPASTAWFGARRAG